MTKGRPDWSPTAVGVYLQPEWAAKEGTDKTFRAVDISQGFGDILTLSYVVPSGKTLYLTSMAWAGHVLSAADYDHFIHLLGEINLQSVGTSSFREGSLTGGHATFPKPIVVAAGDTVRFYVVLYSDITCWVELTALGYEV